MPQKSNSMLFIDTFFHPDCKNAHRSQFSDKQGYDFNNFKWTRELKTAQKYIFTFTSMI
jgi:hypothetical protein